MYILKDVLQELKNKCLVSKDGIKLISDKTKQEIKLNDLKEPTSNYLVTAISINDITQQYELRIKKAEKHE